MKKAYLLIREHVQSSEQENQKHAKFALKRQLQSPDLKALINKLHFQSKSLVTYQWNWKNQDDDIRNEVRNSETEKQLQSIHTMCNETDRGRPPSGKVTFAGKHESKAKGYSPETDNGHHSNVEQISAISEVALVDHEDFAVEAENAEFDGA